MLLGWKWFYLHLFLTAYVAKRFIGESGRIISDIFETTSILQKEGFLVTIDIEKAFDSVYQDFLLTCLERYGFGTKFLSWKKTLPKNLESCVINGGKPTQYFKLERDKVTQFVHISLY